MALFRKSATSGRRGPGMSPFWAAIIALVVIVFACGWAFTRYNPFKSTFTLHAVFQTANNLQPDSPVRIAGVNIGKVKQVQGIGHGGQGVNVTMEIDKKGLPIFQDAEAKIRPRIFLEGNFFVDIQPGSPGAPKIKNGGTIPINQTATPVQFGQVLTALQSDTRADLQILLQEYATKGLGNGGAQAYNQSLKYSPGAFKNSSIANQATLGRQPGDLHNLERGQQRLFSELDSNPEALKDLIVQLNTFAGALAREEAPLQAAIPALRDTLRIGTPALVALNNAFPSLRAFARDALPGTRSSVPALDASIPTVKQLRLLIRPQELRGLVHDLRPTIPALAKLQHGSVPLLQENRALSACQTNVLVPFAKTPIPNPDEPEQSGMPFYQVSPHGLVGLAGESRQADANSPVVHVQFGSGPTTLIYSHQGQSFFAAAPAPPEGVRPIKQTIRTQYRPDIPCETQTPPNMNAAGGPPDRSVTAPSSGASVSAPGLLKPLPNPFNQKIATLGKIQLNEIMDYELRTKRGLPTADPVALPHDLYVKEQRKLGLDVLPSGKVVAQKKGAGK